MNNTRPINELFVVLSVDENGNEGIVAEGNFPLVTSEKRLADYFKIWMDKNVNILKHGEKFVLGRFSRCSHLE